MQKDPQAVLDYAMDWTPWLAEGETIATSSWTVDAGITKDSDSKTTTVATVWLSGGTAGVTYKLTNHITTNQGRTDERSFPVSVRQR